MSVISGYTFISIGVYLCMSCVLDLVKRWLVPELVHSCTDLNEADAVLY